MGTTPCFAEALIAKVHEKGGCPFSMAYELTRIYTEAGGAEAKHIPRLFAELFALFAFGQDPRKD